MSSREVSTQQTQIVASWYNRKAHNVDETFRRPFPRRNPWLSFVFYLETFTVEKEMHSPDCLLSGSSIDRVHLFWGEACGLEILDRRKRGTKEIQRHMIELQGRSSEYWICSCLFSICYIAQPKTGEQKTTLTCHKE